MLPLRMLGLLLLLLLHGVDSSSCPPTVDLLIQHPLIGEYGSTVMVNCTSTTWEHEGITLSVGNHSTGNKDGKNSADYTVQLRDWNTKVKCKIQLNDSTECIKEAEITAYKNPKVALSVKKTDVTQYKLQCDVTDVTPARNLTVTWYRGGEIFTTNSAQLTKEAVNDSFTLVVNVSRAEKVVPFQCQAQLDLGPHTQLDPVTSETHNVSAVYAPELSTNYSDNITVSKGENATLTCAIEGNPPPDFEWTVDGEDLTENTNQLKITEVNKGAIYTCTATNDLGNKSMKIDVHVMEVTTGAAPVTMTTLEAPTQTQAPQGCALILTPPEIMVRFGDPVTVNCTSNTPITGIGWEAPAGGKSLRDATALTWEVEKLELWDIKPTCFANLIDGSQCVKGPNITVYQTPDVSISAEVQGPMIEGREYQLKCDINNVAPVQLKVKWYHGNKTVFTDDIQENNIHPTNVSRYYTVTPERGDNGSVFRCEAELQLGPKGPKFLLPETSDTFIAVVHYKPLFKDFPSNYSVTEGNFTLNELPFETDGNPPPIVKWYFQGTRQIDPHKPLSRNESGNYIAEAGNDIDKTSTSVHITVEYGPSLTCKDQYDVKENSEFENPCELDGIPPPSVTWFKQEKEISLTHWTKDDRGLYTLIATNRLGAVQREFNLQVLYKPLFKNISSNFSGIERNFTLSELPCETDGNPLPTVNWYFRGNPIDPHEPLSRADSGNYVVEAGNDIGTTNTSVLITVEYGPSLTCENQYEVVENDEFRNPCKLDGIPHPSIAWYNHEKKRISSQRWTKHDGGIYTLKATNKHGAVQREFNLQVLYAPEIVDKNATIEITPGQNVTFNCSANGNPSPKINWTSTGSPEPTVTTGERYSIITITEATSLSAGVYRCVATNKVGSMTREVTLALVRTDSRPGWILPFVVIMAALLAFFAILYLLLHNYKKKGHYSFIASNDASHIELDDKNRL